MLQTHGDQKYHSSTLCGGAAEWNALRIEHRHIGPGLQNCVRPQCTELVHILSGHAKVRRAADGRPQEGIARPGTYWLVPAGTNETLLELDGTTECLIILLPAKPLEDSALIDLGIEPETARLAYAAGFTDPTLERIGHTLHGLIGRQSDRIDHLFADGLKTALAAHLVRHYNVDRWQTAERPPPALEAKRVRRVLDYIELRLGEAISLGDLASQACLSPFHFSRLFHEATGRSPHRYLIERRIDFAKRLLAAGQSPLVQIALDTGFGSQSSFNRTFRKTTGLTPRQYREQCRS